MLASKGLTIEIIRNVLYLWSDGHTFERRSVSARRQLPLNLVRLALVVAAPSRSPLLFAWIWRLIQLSGQFTWPCIRIARYIAAKPLYRRCCLPVTPAPGPGAGVIFKPSFVAAHSPSHDHLCLAIRAMLFRLTLFT